MSLNSRIEWTEATWNPIRGCVHITPGCAHCYAATFAERFRDVPDHPYEQGFDPRLVPAKLTEPLRWKQPRVVFVNSMSDLFQETVPDSYIEAVLRVMRLGNWHTYQVLTKRAERMRRLLGGPMQDYSRERHIWWGVSVENKKHGLPRLGELRSTPASVRFLSIEPLLEDVGALELDGIDWVIVGGESGHGARRMDESWVRGILQQCQDASVPFFFKQWGGVHKSRNGRTLGNRTYDDMPERPTPRVPGDAERRDMVAEVEQLARRFSPTVLLPSPSHVAKEEARH